MPRPVLYNIHDRNIQAMISPGGDVASEINDAARAVVALSKTLAPKREGRLSRGIMFSAVKPSGPYEGEARVTFNTRHAAWVILGTPARIYPDTKKRLRIPNAQFIGGWVRGADLPNSSVRHVRSVSGQSGNNFPSRAIETVLRADGKFSYLGSTRTQ